MSSPSESVLSASFRGGTSARAGLGRVRPPRREVRADRATDGAADRAAAAARLAGTGRPGRDLVAGVALLAAVAALWLGTLAAVGVAPGGTPPTAPAAVVSASGD
ncbi:MAG TPA: hypothetical protein VML50_13225 [Anaeromyxobacter sp.]|nr:hypothetical protein [Anaeromyxobacter sp.]